MSLLVGRVELTTSPTFPSESIKPILFLKIVSTGIEPTNFPSLPFHLTTKPPYHFDNNNNKVF